MDTLRNILLLIEEKNISQQELADALGVSKQVITDWKSRKSKSYLKYIRKISDYFNVSVDYLLNAENIDSKQYVVIRKLIDTTEKRILKWNRLISYDNSKKFLNFDDQCSYPFVMEDYIKVEDGYNLDIKQSFFASYENGGYFLAYFIKGKSIQIFLFVYYIYKFYPYSNNVTMPLLNDLLTTVEMQILGFEEYINQFIEDDFKNGELHINNEGLQDDNN